MALGRGRPAADEERIARAAAIFARTALADDLPAFFTTGAYAEHLVTAA